jgi:hypothetical protein
MFVSAGVLDDEFTIKILFSVVFFLCWPASVLFYGKDLKFDKRKTFSVRFEARFVDQVLTFNDIWSQTREIW